MQLTELVQASREVAATRSRLEKTERLAALLSGAESDEIEIVIGFLTGQPRQGRTGVGYRSIG